MRLSGMNSEGLLKQPKDTTVGSFSNSKTLYSYVLEEAKLDPGTVSAMSALQGYEPEELSMIGLSVERFSPLVETRCSTSRSK